MYAAGHPRRAKKNQNNDYGNDDDDDDDEIIIIKEFLATLFKHLHARSHAGSEREYKYTCTHASSWR
jgi:hypothetical protein